MKENRAITLIALIITIIVLLVLAGIAISMLLRRKWNTKQIKNCKRTNRSCTTRRAWKIIRL